MKKLSLLLLMVISVVGLSACQKDNRVSKDDVKAFVKEVDRYQALNKVPGFYSFALDLK
ncbi:hypothetical protein [Lysinibacillus sp. NPDC047702]|uniref:hypothetical protein n=1 Tax=unclassified Lysinibacillus TaxID=2636778 RepID=UPI003D05AFE1